MLMRLRALLAVMEAQYGVDPGSGYGALLMEGAATLQVQGEKKERQVLRGTLSPEGHFITEKRVQLSVPLELKGGGVTNSIPDPPEADALLRACALQRSDGALIPLTGVTGAWVAGETVTNTTTSAAVGTVVEADGSTLWIRDLGTAPADTNTLEGDDSGATGTVSGTPVRTLVYRPVSDPAAMESATLHYHLDGIRHVVPGVRGSVKVGISGSDGYGKLSFELQGMYAAPTDQARPSAAVSDLTPMRASGVAVSLAGLTTALGAKTAIELDLGNKPVLRKNLSAADGIEQVAITDRAAAGSIDPDVQPLATFNPFTAWAEGAKARFAVTLGSAAGNRLRVLAPAVQYTEVAYQDRDKKAAYRLPFSCTGGDDDELFLIFY